MSSDIEASQPMSAIQSRLAMLDSIVESSDDAILSTNLDRVIISWNPGAERMYGYLAKEILGQSNSLLLPHGKMDETLVLLKQIRAGLLVKDFDTERKRKDGIVILISLTMSPIYDEAGVIIGASCIHRDISEQKKIFEKVQALAALTEFSDDPINSTDLNGIITSWNPASENLFGYSAVEMIGQSDEILIALADQQTREQLLKSRNELLEKMRNGQIIKQVESIRIAKDGRAIPVSISAAPIFDPNGVVIGMIGSLRDTTEQKKASLYARSLIEASLDPLVTISPEGKITDVNEATVKITGVGREQLIGTDFSEYFTQPDEARTGYQRVFADVSVTDYPLTLRAIDGKLIDVLYNASVYKDSQGKVLGVFAAARDITEQKKAAQVQTLATIVEFSIDAIVSTDPDGIIISWNPAAEIMYGYSAIEMIGETGKILRLPGRETQDVWGQILKRSSKGQEAEYFADERVAKDGHTFSVSLSVSPIYDAAGSIIGLTEIARDITEQKEQMRQLVQATEQRNEFVAMVAHDIRSPATTINGFAHLLLDRWNFIDEQEKIDNLKVIIRKTEHLAKFIGDLLHVSRIEAGEFTFDIQSFDFGDLAQKALLEIADSSQQRFHLVAPDKIPPVLGDKERQWDVLMNLLTNAAKFSPADSSITIQLVRNEDSVQVSVIDHGAGIPEAEQPKLFQKFGRLPQPGRKKVPGTGLGLFICKNLVEAQGGKLWYEDTSGQGATFSYTVPISGGSKKM